MTLLVYCAWETRVMRTNLMLSNYVKLGLIDPPKMILGGLCSGQFGWPTQQLHSVDIRQLSEEEATEMASKGFYHWYSPSQFTQEQLEWLLSGGVIRHTFGVFDTNDWEFDETFEVINY